MKHLRILLCWLLLCIPAWAAGEIEYESEGGSLTGQTLYMTATVFANVVAGVTDPDNGLSWASGEATPDYILYTGTRATFDIPMTEVGTTGRFLGSLPTHANAINKKLRIKIYQDANDDATPDHATDIWLATEEGYWDGTFWGNDVAAIKTSATPADQLAEAFDNDGIGGDFDVAATFTGTPPAVNATQWAGAATDTSDVALLAQFSAAHFAANWFTAAGVAADAAAEIGAATSAATAGPIEHTPVSFSRTVTVSRRADGTGATNRPMRLREEGETLWFAVNCDNMLADNQTLVSMATPVVTGDADITVTDYGVFGTLAKIKIDVAATATTDDTATIQLTVAPFPGESMLIDCEVEVIP